MASTVLPNGIIIPEKYSRDWYADLYHNWQELDNLLSGGGANDGTLTIQKNGTTVGTFSANQATDETVNIEVPDVNNGTLTIQQNGTTVDTFTANSSSDKTVNIQCVDLTNNQTVGGNKEFTGTTTAHDVIPSATDTYNFGSSSAQWNNAYIKSLTINGVACGNILTHNASEFASVNSLATVATSGSYNDLNNKPTIPTVNDATLTIQKNGTTVNTFTANSSSDKTVNIQCVDLTNNQTVGGIKTFSNAPVVGSINLDGKTIDTDANGNMTFNGNKVLTNANLTFSYDSNTETLTVTY